MHHPHARIRIPLLLLATMTLAAGCRSAADSGGSEAITITPPQLESPVAAEATPSAPGPISADLDDASKATGIMATDVADLLENPPAPGESVEIDAYFGGEYGMIVPGVGRHESMSGCPSEHTAPLTDRPYQFNIHLLSMVTSNELPAGAAWLVAATEPESELRLPFHGRFRGRLGDPRFSHCERGDRIFVVDAVVQEYEPSIKDVLAEGHLADEPDAWMQVAPSGRGYTVTFPRGWQVDDSDPDELLIRSPDWPAHPVSVRLGDGGSFDQSGNYSQQYPMRDDTPPLSGPYTDDCAALSTERCAMIHFTGNGRTYALTLRYPIGFDASQRLLDAYTGIVDRFGIDGMPTKTPTPPVQTALGAGPFWSREQAEDMALRMIPSGPWKVDSARLVPEAEARTLDLCDIDGTAGLGAARDDTRVHPEGVWIVRLVGLFDERPATYSTYLDAVNGRHLCTADEATRSGG